MGVPEQSVRLGPGNVHPDIYSPRSRGWKSKAEVSQGWFSLRSRSLTCIQPSPPCVPTELHLYVCVQISSHKDTSPVGLAPLCSLTLLQSPIYRPRLHIQSHPEVPGVRTLTYGFGGDTQLSPQQNPKDK